MPAPPDWVTLRIFLAALDLGSVTRAADRCSIAPSAAAKRIQLLEANCGLPLLERGARGSEPRAPASCWHVTRAPCSTSRAA